MIREPFIGSSLESVESQVSEFINSIKKKSTFIKMSVPYINKDKNKPYQIDVTYDARDYQIKTQFN